MAPISSTATTTSNALAVSNSKPSPQNHTRTNPSSLKPSPDQTPLASRSPQATESENIHPSAAAAEQPSATKDKEGLKDRDMRAYEHDRQRSKQAGEWAKRRARKAAAAVTSPGANAKGAKSVKGGKADVDVEVDVYAVNGILNTDKGFLEGFGASPVRRRDHVVVESLSMQVNLADLIDVAHKKPRKEKDDFEVIPPLRSVIVLDDMTEVHDMDVDEPWEHVSADEDREDLEPSYATIVVGGGH
ncbi:hypothetical protein B0H34DRAFT_8602 [Crassisporium funariophilum]|nr:hypothetical protein B0H34DRAFT_8602 [Crassisporium funariophilum]